ncbi:MAG: DNA-3-methyladenine glycosylase I [Breznakibacter sp.]
MYYLILDSMALQSNISVDRCDWTGTPQLMIDYHDHEWGVPVHDDTKHFEFLVLDAFQAGLSWSTVLKKREAFRAAFAGFNVHEVAQFQPADVDRLMNDASIIRNRSKIEATIRNANAFIGVQAGYGAFDKFIWQFTGYKTIHNHWQTLKEIPAVSPEAEAMSKALKSNGFYFVGPTICYAYMQAAGMVNDHVVGCFRHAQLM